MKLYRYLCEEELKLILQGRTARVGMMFEGSETLSNTHNYKKGNRYLHFFFKKEDCEYIKRVHNLERNGEQKYIAEFKIPLKKIIGHIGKGFYYPLKGGYKYEIESVHELSLPNQIFNPSWLVGYEKVSDLDSQHKESVQSK